MKFINTTDAPAPIGAYAQATAYNGVIYVSGQLPIDSKGEMAKDVRTQTKQSLNNILAILQSQGSKKENILKVQVFTTDLNSFTEINEEYQSFFGKHTPARAVVEVSALPKGAMVEIDTIAIAGE
ncbi:RidA family protein [Vibrio sp. MA40-2]|uniref:RidA family protein n=1 Tax=Vibrio sp. MA40-2 TaxID=3391828 RepID=UPI0039A622C5